MALPGELKIWPQKISHNDKTTEDRLFYSEHPAIGPFGSGKTIWLETVAGLRRHFDVPLLLVSHHPLELQVLCDEVIALGSGKVIAQGEPTGLSGHQDRLDLHLRECMKPAPVGTNG